MSGFLTPAGVLRFAQAQAERIPLSPQRRQPEKVAFLLY